MTPRRLLALTLLSCGGLCASAAAAVPGTIRMSAHTNVGRHTVLIIASGRSNDATRLYVYLNPGRVRCRASPAAERRLRTVKRAVHQGLHRGPYQESLKVDKLRRGSHLACGYLAGAGGTVRTSARYVIG